MTGIWNGIQVIIDSLLMPIKLISSIIGLTNKMLTILAEIVVNVYTLITTLPNWLIAFPTLTIGIIIIYQLLGRSTGK